MTLKIKNGPKRLFQEQNSRGLGRDLSMTEAAGRQDGGAGGGHGVLDGSGRTELARAGATVLMRGPPPRLLRGLPPSPFEHPE